MRSLPQLYVAIDSADLNGAIDLAGSVVPIFGGIKLGLEFYIAHGKQGVKALMAGLPEQTSLFLDLKLHDIPNTVVGALKAVKPLGADYITLHASGGFAMMRAANDALQECNSQILAVTILTSLSEDDITSFSTYDIRETVLRLANTAVKAGCAGLVCSPHEVEALRGEYGDDIALMVPGIRLSDDKTQDQKRVMTPVRALELGASHLVIGRAVTATRNPSKTAQDIVDMMPLKHAA